MKLRRFIITAAIILTASFLNAADEFKKFERTSSQKPLLEIYFDNDQINITIFDNDTSFQVQFDKEDVRANQDEIRIKDTLALSKKGFALGNQLYGPELMGRMALETNGENETRIVLYRKDTAGVMPARSRRQNEITFLEDIVIAKDRFLRGGAVAFWGDILVDGEVNEDVVAIFGNVTIGDNAVVRGNVVSLNGEVNLSKKATIYGSIRTSSGKKNQGFDRWKKWYRRDRFFSPVVMLYYNRVDGAAPYLGVKYQDEDSVLPKFTIYGGYGFESERWRFVAEAEQTVLRSLPLAVGGSFYKKLSSNDGWLLSEAENTAFALLATEDYKDYYEAEGGSGYVRVKPFGNLTARLGVMSEKYKWLDGHKNLWSLFGGSKRFGENFSTIIEPVRGAAIKQLDGSELSSVTFSAAFETEMPEELFASSYWKGVLDIEWAPGEWNDDYVFTRYQLTVTRHQELSRQSGLVFKGYYGGADNPLPLSRKYFLGGLGTLHGYEHKEFYGSEFWLANLEYGVRFPNSEMVGWIFYNVGQITEEPISLSEAEVRHSVGLGLAFGNDIRMLVGKRLDRSDVSPVIYVRFQNLFE